MHLRYANDCVLSLQVPVTGIVVLSGIEKITDPTHRGLRNWWATWHLQGRALGKSPTNLETFSLHVKSQLDKLIQI